MPRFTHLSVPTFVVCLVATLAPSAVNAQNQSRLYAAVSDENGEPVLDLVEDDFELSLDGTPVTLASVELDNVPPRIALLIDTGGKIRELNAETAIREGLEGFLSTLAPHLEVGIVTLAPSLQLRGDFTTDRRTLINMATGLFAEGGVPRLMDGLRETSERFESWEDGFEARDPWPIFVLVVANGDDASSYINPGQYSDFVNDLVTRQATVHAVVLVGEGTVQATSQNGRSLARPQPLAVPEILADPLAGGGAEGAFPEGSVPENTEETIFQIAKNVTDNTRGRFVSINAATGFRKALTELADRMNHQAAQVSTRYRLIYEVPEDTSNGQLRMRIRSYDDLGAVSVEQFTDRSQMSTAGSGQAQAFRLDRRPTSTAELGAEALRRDATEGDVEAIRNLAEMYLSGNGVGEDPEEAARWLRLAADQGDAVAQNDLGFLHTEGIGVEQDQAEAVRWFRLAADQGEASAQFNLGLRYDTGDGIAQDRAEAARLYRQAAEQEHADAQFHLGGMYDGGRGVARDTSEAIHWYRLAAQRGHALAQFHLATIYAEGLGDPAQAIGWYRLAAQQGHAASQNNLGVMYGQGQGVPRNDIEAVRWHRLAAEQGSPDAQFNLGAMYAQGRGVPHHFGEAARWFRLAANQGLPAAQRSLGFMFDEGRGVAQSYAEAAKWYRLAAEQGLAHAQNDLGMMYDNGRGVPQDDAEAVGWYRPAADQGHVEAQFNLGHMYAEGRGITEDDVEAARLYRLAADQGHLEAGVSLGQMFANGRGVAQDDAEAVRLYRLAATQGVTSAQVRLGLMYDEGRGVRQDPVTALMWLTLAVTDEPDDFVVNLRDALAAEMPPEQVAEAERLAREWKPTGTPR